ncbi:protein-disulfide reductase DsbD [Stenotrophomonas sp. NPDC077421]|uniref:protein-disulfide reductase DsbD n=1 Tax=Stenotrophomonas sp. NPDC077421 TaxID=3414699 RepID=UPI003C2C5670
MKSIPMRALLLLLLALPFASAAQVFDLFAPAASETTFLDPEEVFRVDPPVVSGDTIRVTAQIEPGYYVYRHRLSMDADGAEIPLGLPSGERITDEFFGETEVYRETLEFDVGSASGGAVTLHWQGCADAGICYPPQTMALTLPEVPGGAVAGSSTRTAAAAASQAPAAAESVADETARGADSSEAVSGDAAPAAAPAEPVSAAAVPPETPALAEDQAFAQRLTDSGPAMAALVFFGLGLLLAFTPCVLPMIPIVSSLVVGGRPSPGRALMLSTAYVLPMALTYAALGVAAGLSGANLQATLQNPWLLGAFALLFVVLAMAMFGAFELQLPAWLRNRLDRASRGQQGGTLAGAAALGVLSAVLVGPCMTAPLAGALLYIGQSGDPVVGGVALFALGLGMGVPLLLIAVFGARVLPAPGPWMERVKAAFGFMLLGMAVYMVSRVLPGSVSLALWGAWLLVVAIGLVAFAADAAPGTVRRWGSRSAAAVVGVWAVAMMFGGASGATDPWRPLQPLAGTAVAGVAAPSAPARPDYVDAKSAADLDQRLAEAGARGEWTLVDFYADWCVTCHIIEREVFGDPRVAERLARMQVVRPDVTANDAVDRELMKAWEVVGPPTLMLISPDGREARALRTVGDISADQFLQRLDQVGAGEEA